LGKVALLLPLVSLLINFHTQNLSQENSIRPFVTQLLHAVPPNAILQTPGDATIFALWYFQQVEGYRPDIILVDANLFAFDWYRTRLQTHYPRLRGLEADDLAQFQRLNEEQQICILETSKQNVTVCP
jgi:hypothetical protein